MNEKERKKAYVVFPPKHQPTPGEIGMLNDSFSGIYTVGVDRDTYGLALELDQGDFMHQMEHSQDFRTLINTWKEQGAKILRQLDFKEDSFALKPRQVTKEPHTKRKNSLARKEMEAKESLARLKLKADRAAHSGDGLAVVAKYVPHALVAGGMIGMAATGLWFANRVKNMDIEKRSDTIERVSKDPLHETLSPLRKKPESHVENHETQEAEQSKKPKAPSR